LKWDAITRSGGGKIHLVGAVELLLVDEIHHIGDTSRGATLEAVILRMMNLKKREHEEFSWQPIRDM
jgi:replicative superfamily II helicase